MSKTLMILAHPRIEESIGNKIISEGIAQQENAALRHLDKLYPNFKIDIEAEQKALLAADTIIFQFPLYWYSSPSILKRWINKVMQYGFAFGNDNYHLENKKIIASFTMGSPVKDYPPEVIEKIVFPFQGLANYCKMNYVGEVFSNDINDYADGAKEKAIKISNKHVEELLTLIKK